MNKIIYLLFTLSGVAGLVYEAVWSRYLKLFLGHSSLGQILTLVIYMGGISIGSFIGGKISKRFRNPFYAYAAIELVAGIGGFIYHKAYLAGTAVFYQIVGNIPGSTEGMVKIIISSLITLPEAVLLGATFPVLAAGVIRLNQDQGKSSLPRLYFFNTIGAAFGIIVTSYYLIAAYGTPGTLILAGSLNIIIAIGFYFIAKQTDSYFTDTDTFKEEQRFENKVQNTGIKLWLIISFLTGLSSFIYEIGWIRLLSLLLGSSTHSFDIMVSAFVLGLAVGGYYSRSVINKAKDLVFSLAVIQILMGIFAISSIFLYKPFFDLMNTSHLIFMKTGEGYIVYSAFKYLLCLLLMFPTVFMAGMTLPILTYIAINQTKNEKYTGYIYGWNTIGAILGASIGGLLILPLLQLKLTILTGALIDLALGLILIKMFSEKITKFAVAALASVLPVIAVFFYNWSPSVITAGQFRKHYNTLESQAKVIVRDGRTATISYHETPTSQSIRTNGKPDALTNLKVPSMKAEGDDLTMLALAYYPMNIMDKPYNAALIGMGSGLTAHYLLSDDYLKSLDLIEIEREMYHLAKNFQPLNSRVYEDKRVNVIFDDAKTYFYSADKKYDLIISEPSNPWVSGVSSLFTEEFYQHVNKFLAEDGILVQWIHTYEFNSELFLSVLKAMSNNFSQIKIYHNGFLEDITIVASNSDFTPANFSRFAGNPEIEKDFKLTKIKPDFFSEMNFVMPVKAIEPLLKSYNPNSDFFPLVDSYAEKTFYTKQHVDLFNPFVKESSIGFYEEITEGYSKEEIKRKSDKKQSVPVPAEARNALRFTNFLLTQKDNNNINWLQVRSNFENYLYKYRAYNPVWNDDLLVKRFRELSAEGIPPKEFSMLFGLIDELINHNYDSAAAKSRVIIEQFKPGQLGNFYIREMAILSLKLKDKDLYATVMGKYIQNNPSFGETEKKLLISLGNNYF